jgi:hypothetical protein
MDAAVRRPKVEHAWSNCREPECTLYEDSSTERGAAAIAGKVHF